MLKVALSLSEVLGKPCHWGSTSLMSFVMVRGSIAEAVGPTDGLTTVWVGYEPPPAYKPPDSCPILLYVKSALLTRDEAE